MMKDGQRSHLSASAASKAATIFGAASCERASLKPPPAHIAPVTHWEDADLDSLGLTRYGVDLNAIVANGLPARTYRCWTEDWEVAMLHNPDIEAQAKFLNKYGGLVFHDGDTVYTIHPAKMQFCRRRGNMRWMVFAVKESYDEIEEFEEDFDCFDINNDLHGLVFSTNKKHPNPKLKVLVEDDCLDIHGEWDAWVDEVAAPKRKRQRRR
jgi:hypothetical protein